MMLPIWSLYFSRNSPALENAIWLMYLSTSSSVIPRPLSMTLRVLASSSSTMRTFSSPSSPLNSPETARAFIFWSASTAFATSSRRKISWSEYRNFLITGKMFSVVTPILPLVSVDMIFDFLFLYSTKPAARFTSMNGRQPE